MTNVFVKNNVVDKRYILSALEQRKSFTEENLKKEWEQLKELSEDVENNLFETDGEFNYLEYYDFCFRTSLMYLTLDELEYIRDNNLYEFKNNNLLDYRCQAQIDKRINDYRKIITNLTNVMQRENIGSYFQGFSSLFNMSSEALNIIKILGLERENVELTSEGKKLKKCLDNINSIFHESWKRMHEEQFKKR